jgi:hypothetical protein
MYAIMRAAVHALDRETIFYTFDGRDWNESGRTSWGNLRPNTWRCAGGDAVILLWHGTDSLVHSVYDGTKLMCEFQRPHADIAPFRIFYESGKLVFLSTDFRSLISCGTTHRWVDADTQIRETSQCNAIYRDGRVYMQNAIDGYVETDIPTHLVRVCDDGRNARVIGMHMESIYAMDIDGPPRLWCRDLRAPLPFNTPIGASVYGTDECIVTNDGLILMARNPRPSIMQIVDIRSTDSFYEISTESMAKGGPYISLPPY